MNEALKARIDEMIKRDRVVVFMKGTAVAPMCGFSAAAIEALQAAGAQKMTTYNVLEDPELRQGIKEYTNWPTIPQVYIDGKFIGGCDIVRDLYDSGELAELLREK